MKSTERAASTYTEGLSGGCLCAGVRYQIKGEVREVVNCFCKQCQRTTGNFVAATRVAKSALTLIQETSLQWFSSSPGVQRGFCSTCGSSLFWENAQRDQISIMAGTLDQPTNLKTTLNIYTADASDFHLIPELDSID